MNINTYFEKFVSKVESDKIIFNDQNELASDITIWLAGVCGSSDLLTCQNKVNKRIRVDNYLQREDEKNVFAAGDVAFLINPKTEAPIQQMVEMAEYSGHLAANNIIKTIEKKELKPFNFTIHGTDVSFGKKRAIAELMGIKMTGRLARIAKTNINIYYYFVVGGPKLVIKKVFNK